MARLPPGTRSSIARPVRALHGALAASLIPDIVAAELFVRAPLDAARLNGSGLLVVNPPYRFEQEVPPILDALLTRLGDREAGEGTALIRIAAERGGRATAENFSKKHAAAPGTNEDAPKHDSESVVARHGGDGETVERGTTGRAASRHGGVETTRRGTLAKVFEHDGNAVTAGCGTSGRAAGRGGVCG